MSSPNSTVAMPTRVSVKPFSEVTTLREALSHPEMIERFKMATPRHLSPERMLRVFAMAVQKTPKLAECHMMTVLGAMLSLASLGLEPNTPLGHAYLIPFEKKKKVGTEWITERVDCNVVIGYKGYLDLMRRSGMMKAIHADVVYEGDEFSFEYGSNMHLKHIPIGEREGRKPLWAYAHVSLQDGQAFEVLPYAQVLKVRDNSEGYKSALRMRGDANRPNAAYLKNPWVAFEHEMAAKTMMRRMAKTVPMTIEFANAAALDALSEVGKADLASIAKMPVMDLSALEAPSEQAIDLNAQAQQPEQKQGEPVVVQAANAQPAQPQQAAKVEQPNDPPQTNKEPPAGGFDLIDEEGEYIGKSETALGFANWLNEKMQKSRDVDTLKDNNRPTADEILANPDAGEAATLLQAIYGGQPAADLVIEMPQRNGKPYLAGFVEDFTKALENDATAEAIAAREEANKAAINALPGGTRVNILKAIAARKQALGIAQAK